MIALRRLAQADEIAEVACFLASSKAPHVTGQTIVVDGGFSL
jgi:NAD(P)-dependent dehydrogenase (short-subunit alcohol dehydrogenase family)